MRPLAKAVLACLLGPALTLAQPADPLPSWNDGGAKQGIVAFVKAVTDEAGKDHVPRAERIAAFDNDGTLWAEQPLYFQFVFMLDQVKAAARQHPEWRNNPAFKALVAHDHDGRAPVIAHEGLFRSEGACRQGSQLGADGAR